MGGLRRQDWPKRPPWLTTGQCLRGSESAMDSPSDFAGLRVHSGYLDRPAQAGLLAELREIFVQAPLFTPRMPKSGRPFTVRMSNCGPLGWVSDEKGYRYEPNHPVTGRPWPPIPDALLTTWDKLAGYPSAPEACLI